MLSEAEWAIKTKTIKSQNEYRVLACSNGQLGEAEFTNIFNTWAVGNIPDIKSTYDPITPWITIAHWKSNGRAYVCVVHHDWSNYADFRSRRVLISSCLCIPFEDLAKSQYGLVDLAKLFEHVNFSEKALQVAHGQSSFTQDPFNINLSNILPSNKQIPEENNQIGLEAYMNVAASLLHGSVALIIQPDQLTWEQCLEDMDLILSFLPYGIRANCPVSTWAQSSMNHKMRLHYCNSPRSDQMSITWRQTGKKHVIQMSDLSTTYYKDLIEISNRHSTNSLVKHLGEQIQEIDFSNPVIFTQALDYLDRPFIIYQKIRRNNNILNQVLKKELCSLLDSGGINQLEPSQRVSLLKILINETNLSPELIPIIRNAWDDEVLPLAIQCARNALKQLPQQQTYLENLTDLIQQIGSAENLFNMFLDELKNHGQSVSKIQLYSVIRLLHNTMKNEQTSDWPDILANWAVKMDVQDMFFYEWAWLLSKNEQNLEDPQLFIEVLRQRTGGLEIKALKIAWGILEQKLDAQMIDRVNQLNPSYPIRLLLYAASQNRMENILHPFAQWFLPQHINSDQKNSDYWTKLFGSKSIELHAIASWADLDVLFLNMGMQTIPLMLGKALELTESQFNEYIEEFIKMVLLAQRNRENFLHHLNNYLDHHDFNLAVRVTGNNKLELLLTRLGKDLNTPLLSIKMVDLTLDDLFRQRVSPREMADTCVRFLLDKQISNSAEKIVSSMIKSHYPDNVQVLDELLTIIFQRVDLPAALYIEMTINKAILSGRLSLGEDIIEYKKRLVKRLNAQLDYLEKMAPYLSEQQFGNGHFELKLKLEAIQHAIPKKNFFGRG